MSIKKAACRRVIISMLRVLRGFGGGSGHFNVAQAIMLSQISVNLGVSPSETHRPLQEPSLGVAVCPHQFESDSPCWRPQLGA